MKSEKEEKTLKSEPESFRFFKADNLELDTGNFKVDETAEFLRIHPVTIAREGVFPYEDGLAYKPGDELKKAAEVSRVYLAWDHPPTRIVTRREHVKGYTEGVHIQEDPKGTKVKATLVFSKPTLSADQQELLRSGARRDLSIGFFYEQDQTSGIWNGNKYEYVMREILFDHVASVDHGRCSFPACGIGVDQAGADKELSYAERKKLPDSAFAYIAPNGERKLPIHDREHVIAALQVLQGARGGVDLPSSARGTVKRKVCAAAKRFGVKSAFCGTANADNASALIRTLLAQDRVGLVELHRRIHGSDDYTPESRLHRAVLFALSKK